MKKVLFVAVPFALVLGLAAYGPTAEPIPQGTVAAETAPAEASAPPVTKKAEPKPEPVVSACDAVREAFLTGTEAEIAAALKALQADVTADATAREYAKNWLVRDKGDPTLQEMDESLITMSCTPAP